MLVDRRNLPQHRRWIAVFVVGTLAATVWCLIAGWNADRWPGGSSLPGLVFGTMAGLIILFELSFWFRKRRRAWRVGRAQVWMRAHIWLGLLCVPLVAFHSGGSLGGQLSTALVVLLAIVVGSGLYGLALQQYLPKLLLDLVPAETIYSEIEHISEQNCFDAEDLVLAICGPAKDNEYARFRPKDQEVKSGYLAVAAYRAVGKTRGKVLQTQTQIVAVPNSESMRKEFYTQIGPYLKEGPRRSAILKNPRQSAQFFTELKGRLALEAHRAVDELEEFCFQRQQFDLQARIHRWLHGWLLIHGPLSVMLFALLLLHIYVAWKYW